MYFFRKSLLQNEEIVRLDSSGSIPSSSLFIFEASLFISENFVQPSASKETSLQQYSLISF
jgi:hypothetical protein